MTQLVLLPCLPKEPIQLPHPHRHVVRPAQYLDSNDAIVGQS